MKTLNKAQILLVCASIILFSHSSQAYNSCSEFFTRPPENIEQLILQTERLEIRPAQQSEIESLITVFLNRQVAQQTGEFVRRDIVVRLMGESQVTLREAQSALNDPAQSLFLFNLGIFLNGKVIGGISMREHPKEWMDIIQKEAKWVTGEEIIKPGEKWITYGVVLLPEFQGKGYGREITQKRLQFAFEALKVDGILVDINPQNKASIGLSTQFGFRPLGLKVPWQGYNDLYYLKSGN